MSFSIGRCLLAVFAAAVMLAPSAKADPLQAPVVLAQWTAQLPSCDDPGPLGQIASRFGQKESGFWNSELRIVDFVRVREVAFRPWAVDTMPRRFCTGQVVVSDGLKHRVNYSIIEGGGTLGVGYGVEWCVVGFDRNLAYNPACRMALP